MNLLAELSREHSSAMRNRIVAFVGQKKDRFGELVEIFLAGPYRVTQRAAWPLSYCVQKQPELILPHLSRVLSAAERPGAMDAVKRNIVRLLQFVDIPRRYHGRVVKLCFGYLQNRKEPIAVRVFSMTVLANLTEQLPELSNELCLLIEDELPYGSAGFLSRGKKILHKLRLSPRPLR
jgi:hypothetical protein